LKVKLEPAIFQPRQVDHLFNQVGQPLRLLADDERRAPLHFGAGGCTVEQRLAEALNTGERRPSDRG
jgi:hypothetical protein